MLSVIKKISLNSWIIIGLLAGVVVGQLLYDPGWNSDLEQQQHTYAGALNLFEFVGFTVFMSLLKMLVIPLIFVSVAGAVTSISDVGYLGKLGWWTLVYYVGTMIIAVVTGIFIVSSFQPGNGISLSSSESTISTTEIEASAEGGLIVAFQNLIDRIIPENIFSSLANGEPLPLIFFSLFFGIIVALTGEKAKPLANMIHALYAVVMRMVEAVLLIAPFGVFCLLAWSIARIGLQVFGESIGLYMITVIVGLFIHGFVTLPLILWLIAKVNPLKFLIQMRPALFTAFGTDSSAATLPVTIDTALTKGGVKEKVAGLVFPLGATVNMDGTALYEAVAVIFIAQAYGVDLTSSQYILIAITATFAAIGAASVPSAGLVTMVMVIETVNQSLTSSGSTTLIPVAGIALIIGVDRILDMCRTTVNVWGDAVGAKLLSEKLSD